MKPESIDPKPGQPTLTRYIGKICPKHPDDGGIRYISNACCLSCLKQRQRVKSKESDAREDRNARRRAKAKIEQEAYNANYMLHENIRVRCVATASRLGESLSGWWRHWDLEWSATPEALRPVGEKWAGYQKPRR